MKDMDSIKKMLDMICKIQESTKDDPVIQTEIRKTLDKIGDSVKKAHSALSESLIKDIQSNDSLSEEEKEALIKKLNEENEAINGKS